MINRKYVITDESGEQMMDACALLKRQVHQSNGRGKHPVVALEQLPEFILKSSENAKESGQGKKERA